MEEICGRVTLDQLGAVYVQGRLIIWAKGKQPTPCHKVRIEKSPVRVVPPQYQLFCCVPKKIVCPQMETDYRYVNMFITPPQDEVTVTYFDGEKTVKVFVFDDSGRPNEKQHKEAVATGVFAGGWVPEAFRAGRIFETGNSEDLELVTKSERVEATGYSNSFSFDEAYQDAVNNLPPDPNPFPDKLITVQVEAVGGIYGGITGAMKMFVRVAAFY